VKCKTTRDIDADAGCFLKYITTTKAGKKIIASGTQICRDEFPLANCVALVQNGLADPADEECRVACNRTESEIAVAKEAMDRLLNGKGLPEDEDEDDEESEE
tara:strand:- start:7444 stop:7752 length:309 start_codon:yes stop_codon:yes gene_type:complete